MMKIPFIFNMRRLSLVVLSLGYLTGCGLFGGNKESTGDLTGVLDRPEGWVMTTPYGMVPIPAGTFHMGQADEDVGQTQINYNKQVTIGGFFMDDTEITNNEYRQFIEALKEDSLSSGTTSTGITVNGQGTWPVDSLLAYYPDTTVFVKDFSHHMGDPLQEYYYSHPAYDNYPVVGVSWVAAQYFCKWRTDYLNDYHIRETGWPMPAFRLPSEAEWEYAARGGRSLAKYPWGNPYIRNAKGCMLANFKPGRGNYYDDGYAYTSPVGEYFPNDYGLYDMAGNVSEWTQDAFHPASVPLVWDLNPEYKDPNEKRKVIRGGSWKDVAFFLETGTRAFEYQDSTRAYIGFRCAMTHLGRSSGREF